MQQAATVMAARPYPVNGVPTSIMSYDFEPLTRARSNTWPCPPRPDMIKEEDIEDDGCGGGVDDILLEHPELSQQQQQQQSQQQHQQNIHQQILLNAMQGPGPGPGGGGQQLQLTPPNSVGSGASLMNSTIPEFGSTQLVSTTTGGSSNSGTTATGLSGIKKSTSSRRNAWGNMSYADLITQAIGSSPEKRLTLSQIYDWMVGNVPYFKDKGDSNSSAGWKNSIRHNLSLHNRFMRVQNEGTGKSSWWMLNPDAKPGKAARRRATTLETSKFEKKRGRIKKKLENMRNGIIDSPCSSLSEGLDVFPGPGTVDEDFKLGSYPGPPANLSPEYRPRASSNASSCGRRSPILRDNVDLHDNQVPPMSPWGGDYYSAPGPYDRFMADEALAGNLANTMKLGEPLSNPEFSYHHSPGTVDQNYPPQQQHQFQRNSIRETDYSAYIPYNAQNGVDSRVAAALNQATAANGTLNDVVDTKADLDFIEQIESTFDCNVEDVLQNELSLGSDIDFSFGALGGAQQHLLAHAQQHLQHQAQQPQSAMLFGTTNNSLHHHLMTSPLMAPNGASLMATGRANNPNVSVAPSPNTSGRPWVH